MCETVAIFFLGIVTLSLAEFHACKNYSLLLIIIIKERESSCVKRVGGGGKSRSKGAKPLYPTT